MTLQMIGGQLLISGGSLANDAACCCDCTIVGMQCWQFAEAGVRGVAGTQPTLQVTIDTSTISNVDQSEPCTNDCEGCPGGLGDGTYLVDPCDNIYEETEDVVQCNGGGLLAYTPADAMNLSVSIRYEIETDTVADTTTATITVIITLFGRGSCGPSTISVDNIAAKFTGIYELTVSNPTTYLYEGPDCTDTTTTTDLPAEITGTFTTVSEAVEYYLSSADELPVACTDLENIDISFTLIPAPSYTLAAGTGSFTLTGIAASLNVGVIPANTVAPSITGSSVYPASALAGTTGTWTGTPYPDFAYQWQSDGVDIPGAVTQFYNTQASDVGNMIRLKITASNTVGSTVAYSNEIGPITT